MILLPSPQTATLAIDRAIAIIDKQRIGSFVAEFRSLQGKDKKSGVYEVGYIRPDQLRLRAKVANSDRTYWIMKDSLFAVDHKDKEWLLTASKPVGNALQRMSAIVPVDEPVRILVDPGVGKNFLSTFREIRTWTRSGNLWSAKDGRGKFTIGFDNKGRFSSFRVDSPAGWLSWSYRYPAPGTKLEYPSTAGYRKVDAFFDAGTPTYGQPKYQDSKSKAVLDRSIREYNRLTMVAYKVTDDSGVTDVWLNGRSARQRNAKGDWAWDQGKFTLKQGGRLVTSGQKMSWREVDEAVGKAGCPLDPFLAKLGRKENPLTGLLGPDLRGRHVGGLGFGGVMCDVVEFNGPRVRITMTIRRDNALLHAVSTENLDSKAKVLARSEKRYAYSSWGKPVRIEVPR